MKSTIKNGIALNSQIASLLEHMNACSTKDQPSYIQHFPTSKDYSFEKRDGTSF